MVELAVKSKPLVTTMAARGVVPPTARSKVMASVPEVPVSRVRF